MTSQDSVPTFQPCIDSQNLAKRLSVLLPGEVVTYDELNRIVAPARKVNAEHRYLLDTARRLAMKDAGIVTGCVMSVGIKRLTNEEIAKEPAERIGAARRLTARALRRAGHAKTEDLDNDTRHQYYLNVSALGVISQFTTPSKLRRIGEAIKASPERIDFSRTLQLFGK